MPPTPRPELLAPAGDRESLVAAVENGCDAVYLGAQILSARASAANFTLGELADAIDYAHLRGVKAYVTVNTLVKDSETKDAADLLYHLDKSGADSVIVQDMGLLSLARSIVPGLPVHASTQMTVHNSEGARFLQAMGVKRVVLAREMTLDEIRQVRQNTEIEIETFVHGALCISYSGQCLTSSMIGGRSGNRGVCAQPCRKRYELRTAGRRVETDGEYLLSPKDLNLSRVLPELIDAGVDSLKIEGRLKRPEYVACAVWIYRRLIDRYLKDPSGYFVSDDESLRLAQLFNRGFTEAYLGKNPRGTLMSRIRPHNRGIRVGTVTRRDSRAGRISVELSGGLNIGDGIGIDEAVKTVWNAGDSGNVGDIGTAGVGMIVRQMYECGRRMGQAGAGMVVEIPSGVLVPAGSAVYKTLDQQLMDALRRTFTSPTPLRKVPVKIRAKAAVGLPFELQIEDMDSNWVCVHTEYVIERAIRDPTTKEQIVRQLTKLGKTVFEVSDIDIEIEGEVFIPVSQLNLVRNDAVSRLESARIRRVRRGHATLTP
ncbi:MAG: U32 family peptidase, partial [Euryarchaeota archaeon]|nr:U32 family peptidase [Euryarchaeota archaeon]